MIQLVPFHSGMLPRLAELFDVCNTPVATNWAFNPWRTVIAQDDVTGQVVGFVTSWWDRQPIAWVDMLLVHPDHRGKGIGAKLCYMIEALLLKEGVKIIRCVLDDGAEFAPPLERAGYGRLGTYLILQKEHNDTQN